MTRPVLELEGLTVAVGDHIVCRDVDLAIGAGEVHVLLGPNGSGKSSLLSAVMGLEPFRIVSGTTRLAGNDLSDMSITERAQAGLGMAFQHPPRLEGVTVRRFAQAMGAAEGLASGAQDLALTALLDRELNVGFSGGEAKRWEVLKLELQQPLMCLFDEPESGVDLEHVGDVGSAIRGLLQTPTADGDGRAALVITHTGFVLDSLQTTKGHLMIDGRLVAEGDAREMFERIRREGYRA